MQIVNKFNRLLKISRQTRCFSQLNGSSGEYQKIINLSLINCTDKPLIKCPSIKSFQLPINDFQITDIIKRHELTLPEINKNKEIFDPILKFQIEKDLPNPNQDLNKPMYCGRPLFSETKWRSRKMNIKKRKKYQKKMFFVIQKRKQAKEKRYNTLLDLYQKIHEKKTEIFDPVRFINRELEKAKFFGYKCNPIYDQYREILNQKFITFDPKYFKKFEDTKKPLHIRLEEEMNQENKK